MVGSVPFILSLCKTTLSHRHPKSDASYQDNWHVANAQLYAVGL